MDLHRKTSLIAGIFFACTFVFSIPALLFYDPLLNHVSYVVGAGAVTRVAFGAFFEIIVVISNIATAVVLFPILKRQNETVSLGYVASRIVESTIIIEHLMLQHGGRVRWLGLLDCHLLELLAPPRQDGCGWIDHRQLLIC